MYCDRKDLNWIKNKPKISYNQTLGRPVFVNPEAFYVCLSGSVDATIFDHVEFETDSHFDEFFKEHTGSETVEPKLVSQFINGMVQCASQDYQNFDLDEGVDVFQVPPEDLNTHNKETITWMNTEQMDRANKKFNAKLKQRELEDLPSVEEATKKLSEDLANQTESFIEYAKTKGQWIEKKVKKDLD
tara:strand:- start:4768 stop:5328 length:561 start_codon:yes stop_codon:yes gene_type:complete